MKVVWLSASLALLSGLAPFAACASADEPVGGGFVVLTAQQQTECRVNQDESLRILSEAVASTPRACTSDSDCILYERVPNCVYNCGLTAAVADRASLDAAVDRVNKDFCPAICEPIPPPCVPPGLFDQPRAVCSAGECTLDTYETILRETFQSSVYPLLRERCQACHSSESRNQEPLLGDADVSTAFGATMHFLSWAGEGQRWQADPQSSRLVQQLSSNQHECWTDCPSNAGELASALRAWSDALPER